MKVKNLLKGIKLIENILFKDDRGTFLENYKMLSYKKNGINYDFIQDNVVHSKKNVLRGLHYQKEFPQGKLVSVLHGEILDIAVDIDKESYSYGKIVSEILSYDKCNQLFIPPSFAHGYLVLSDYAIVLYKCTEYYYPEDQYGIIWNDKDIHIDWPIINPIISENDSTLPRFSQL